MRRSSSLFWRIYVAVLLVTLGGVVLVGLIARVALAAAFDSYLGSLPTPMRPGIHPGRIMLGRAEQAFIASVDHSVFLGGVIAVALAAVAAWAIAAHLTKPLRELESAALALADGDLERRVDTRGPYEIVSLGQAFNHMADSLGRAEGLRRRLVADVAHELRNPIAAVRLQVEGIAEGVLNPTAERLDSVVRDIGDLSALVDDLQELALAEAGELRYEMGPQDLSRLLRREAARAGEMVREGVQVRTRGTDAPLEVRIDERRLSQVLRNLLDNALRHTASGSITVDLSRGDDRAYVRVIDTGEGIPEGDLPFIFERFYRADAARASATGGAGLGLAISRRIVEDHGGAMLAEATRGGGATVGFTLPLPSTGSL